MTTVSGRRIFFDAILPEDFVLEDIAHALSNLCHWGGHCRAFFSVAQHSVLVSQLCPSTLAQWGLLHDAAEAYLGDMIRPIKVQMPEYRRLERRFMDRIAQRFNLLPWPEPPELKPYDNLALKLEADFLMEGAALHDGWGKGLGIEVPSHIPPLAFAYLPQRAKRHFLERCEQLFL